MTGPLPAEGTERGKMWVPIVACVREHIQSVENAEQLSCPQAYLSRGPYLNLSYELRITLQITLCHVEVPDPHTERARERNHQLDLQFADRRRCMDQDTLFPVAEPLQNQACFRPRLFRVSSFHVQHEAAAHYVIAEWDRSYIKDLEHSPLPEAINLRMFGCLQEEAVEVGI